MSAVDENSPYADRLQPGVVIMQIDQEDVSDLEAARKALTPGRHLLYVFYRGGVRRVAIDVK